MKNIILVAALGLASFSALAEQNEVVLDSQLQTKEYIGSVGDPAYCKIPEDLSNPKAGDCPVSKKNVETGWKLIKVNGECYHETIEFIGITRIAYKNQVLETPGTKSRRKKVDCPN